MSDTLWQRLHLRRERHRRRHPVVRASALAAGAMLAFLGCALLFALPELGAPGLLVGLSLLALRYDWAGHMHVRAHVLVDAGRGWLVARPPALRLCVLVLPLMTASISLLFAFPFSPLA